MLPSRRPRLIVIAASTGGPPALKRLLAELPADFPVPIVLVQHTLKGMTGSLAEQLAGQTRLAVREAREGELLGPGTLLVAPADWHLELLPASAGRLCVHLHQGPKEQSVRPAADVLFRSAARTTGAGVLALVLTGLGEDGLAGARVIHASGGRVWAQDRASAIAPSMPAKVGEAGLATRVGPPEELGFELARTVLGDSVKRVACAAPPAPLPPPPLPAPAAPKLASASFQFVREFLRREAGITLGESKRYFAEAHLTALADELELPGVEALIERMRIDNGRELRQQILDALTINETSFFRDEICFELLNERLLPGLLQLVRPERRLRVWSAACSSGEEPYSMAMSLRTHFPELATWKLEILATDISQRVLNKAREGLYTAREIGRGLPRHLLERWFTPEGKHWRVEASIRQLVTFELQNLQKPFPARERFDLVLLRNVLIYFDDATKREVLLRIVQAMRPGGLLVLGSADALRDTRLPLRPLRCEPLVAYAAL